MQIWHFGGLMQRRQWRETKWERERCNRGTNYMTNCYQSSSSIGGHQDETEAMIRLVRWDYFVIWWRWIDDIECALSREVSLGSSIIPGVIFLNLWQVFLKATFAWRVDNCRDSSLLKKWKSTCGDSRKCPFILAASGVWPLLRRVFGQAGGRSCPVARWCSLSVARLCSN